MIMAAAGWRQPAFIAKFSGGQAIKLRADPTGVAFYAGGPIGAAAASTVCRFDKWGNLVWAKKPGWSGGATSDTITGLQLSSDGTRLGLGLKTTDSFGNYDALQGKLLNTADGSLVGTSNSVSHNAGTSYAAISYGIALDNGGNWRLLGQQSIGTSSAYASWIRCNAATMALTNGLTANCMSLSGGFSTDSAIDTAGALTLLLSDVQEGSARAFRNGASLVKFGTPGPSDTITSIWAYDTGQNTFPGHLAIDASGNHYIGGWSLQSPDTQYGPLIVKLDSTGAVQAATSQRNSSGTAFSVVGGMRLDAAGNLYVLINNYSNGTIGSYLLVKFSSALAVLAAYSIVVTDTGTVSSYSDNPYGSSQLDVTPDGTLCLGIGLFATTFFSLMLVTPTFGNTLIPTGTFVIGSTTVTIASVTPSPAFTAPPTVTKYVGSITQQAGNLANTPTSPSSTTVSPTPTILRMS